MRNADTINLIRQVIRESLLLESNLYISKDELFRAVGNAILPERLDIDIPGFFSLMTEIAVAETGYLDKKGNLIFMNEREQGIQGIFQLSPIALDQLRIEKGKEVVAKKEKFNKSGASVNPWNAQKNEDIFGSVKMQAIAACLYMFMMYVKKGRPSLDSVESRAQFWKKYYNTSSDPNGTPEKYIEKVNLMLYNKK